MFTRSISLAALILTTACAHSASLPSGARILPASQIDAMLHQCSRSTPAPGEGSWTPQAGDIAAFETALLPALQKANPSKDWSAFPAHYVRQYVGIVRKGQRYLYANVARVDDYSRKATTPIIVCDGGASFFGAEYDVAAKRITHLDFNGVT